MVHLIKIAVLASIALLPAFAAPLTAETDELIAREPAPAPRRRGSNAANRVSSVVSRVGSTAGRIGSIANRVNSVVSGISGLFGRELDSEEELFLRELLEEFDAREPEFAFDELDARAVHPHPRELEDEMEARELFDEELD